MTGAPLTPFERDRRRAALAEDLEVKASGLCDALERGDLEAARASLADLEATAAALREVL